MEWVSITTIVLFLRPDCGYNRYDDFDIVGDGAAKSRSNNSMKMIYSKSMCKGNIQNYHLF